MGQEVRQGVVTRLHCQAALHLQDHCSYFVALADSKDRRHEQALGLKVPREFLVTDLIVAESVTIVGDRGGGKAGRTLYEYFVDECDVVFVDESLLESGHGVILTYYCELGDEAWARGARVLAVAACERFTCPSTHRGPDDCDPPASYRQAWE